MMLAGLSYLAAVALFCGAVLAAGFLLSRYVIDAPSPFMISVPLLATCVLPTALSQREAHSATEIPYNRTSQIAWVACQAGLIALAVAILIAVVMSRAPVGMSHLVAPVLILWVITGCISAALGQDIKLVVLCGILYLLAVTVQVDYDSCLKTVRTVLQIITIGSVLMWAITGDEALRIGDGRPRELWGVGQLAGLTTHPNSLGALAALSVVIEVYTRTDSLRSTLIKASAISAGGICILFAQSRAGWIAVALGLIAAWAVRGDKERDTVRWFKYSILGLSSACAALLLISYGPRNEQDITYLTSGRNEIWQQLFHHALGSPVWGYGVSVLDPQNRSFLSPAYSKYVGQAHNQMLQSALESGILGLAVLSWILFLCWKIAADGLTTEKPVLYAALTILCSTMLVEAVMRTSFNGSTLLVAMILALFASCDRAKRQFRSSDRGWHQRTDASSRGNVARA